MLAKKCKISPNNRMQSDFDKLRSSQPLMRALYARDEHINSIKNLISERFNRNLFF